MRSQTEFGNERQRCFLLLLLGCCFALSWTSTALAHPVPKDQYDRKIKVKLVRSDKNKVQIVVAYRLEIDELTAVKDVLDNFSDEIDLAAAKDKRKAVHDKFTEKFGPILADNVTVKVNGKTVPLKVAKHAHYLNDEKGQPLGHVRCDFEFIGTVEAAPEKEHLTSVHEDNYSFPSPKRGMIDLGFEADPSVPLQKIKQPSEKQKQKPFTDLGPGEELELREASADFTLPKVVTEPSPPIEYPGETESGHSTPLTELFSSSGYSVVMLLLLAVLFGAAHALTPGHGKTLMAAYLVGEQGTALHALVLGLVTTMTHTGAVIGVAIALWFVPKDSVKAALEGVQLIFGLLIVCIGVWLLLCRLSGRADHIHIGGGHQHHHHGHHHHHHHDHAHADHAHDEHGHIVPLGNGQKVSLWRLTVLGMQGGIVPCWDAILMLFLAIGANLLWLALPMLLAFSFGLAGVLVAVGIAVVSAKQFAQSHWGDSGIIRALPIISACIVIGLGVWLCYGGVHG